MVLEELAYHDLTSAWCTMVGATAIASLGTFLPQAGLDRVFGGGVIPTAAISFFPAGRATREGDGFRLNGRGIARHGYPVWQDGNQVDIVRSGGQSPSLGYAIGTLATIRLYALTATATHLPIALTTERAVGVLIATIAMCAISGLLALRKVRKLDPAEVF